MPGGVRALDVAEDERVSRVEPVLRKRNAATQVRGRVGGLGFLALGKADGERKTSQECRARDEGAA